MFLEILFAVLKIYPESTNIDSIGVRVWAVGFRYFIGTSGK
jgi:hypothetical protein